MKITYLELYKCTRFLLNGIEKIKYTPQSSIQMITGTNGAGKSSLLAELSVLPGDGSAFMKGGYKKVIVEHNGHNYELLSDYAKGRPGVHSFIMDNSNVELNPSGNISQQYELVKYHFRYSDEIHQIFVGNEKFSNMSPARRREVLNMICSSDVDYGLYIYNKIKSDIRDMSGSIKGMNKSIIETKLKLISPDVKEKLIEQMELCQKNITEIENYRIKHDSFNSVTEDIIYQLIDELESMGIIVQNQLISEPLKAKSIEELKNKENIYKSKIKDFENLKSMMYEDLYKQEQRVQELKQKTDPVILNEMKNSLDKLTEVIKAYRKSQYDDSFMLLDSNKLLNDIESVDFSALVNYCADLFPNLNKEEFNSDLFNSLVNRISKNKVLFNEMKFKHDHAIEELKRFNESPETVCPECSYRWKVGFVSDPVTEMKTRIDGASEVMRKVKLELDNDNALYDKFMQYRNIWKLIRDEYINKYKNLAPLWNHLMDIEIFYNSPMIVMAEINKYTDALKKFVSNYHNLLKAKELTEAINDINGVDESVLNEALAPLKEFEKSYLIIERKIKVYNDSLLSVQKRIHDAEMNELEYEKYRNAILNFNNNLENYYISVFDKALEEQLVLLKKEYTELHQTINSQNSYESMIEYLEKEITKTTERSHVAQESLKLLSPSDGLISIGYGQFISRFINDANKIIDKVWNYSMIVDNSSIQDILTSYKFPVLIGDDGSTSDINLTSKGQKEMLDFTFMILFKHYLKMDDYPLLLDELGQNFTEEHKTKVFEFITDLQDSGQAEQIFLICHTSGHLDIMNNADIISFDGNNNPDVIIME